MSRSVYDRAVDEREWDDPHSPVHTFNTLYTKGQLPPDMRLKEIALYDPATAAYMGPEHPSSLERLRNYKGPQPPPPGKPKERRPSDDEQIEPDNQQGNEPTKSK